MYYLFEKKNCTLNFIFYAKNSVTYVTLIIKSLHKWMSLFFFLLSIVLSIQIWCHYLDLEPGIPRTVSYITGWSHINSSPYTGTVYGCYHWFGTLPKNSICLRFLHSINFCRFGRCLSPKNLQPLWKMECIAFILNE